MSEHAERRRGHRRESDSRIEDILQEQARQRAEQSALREEMGRNTALTEAAVASIRKVEKNTADLVTLQKGSKVTVGLFRIVGKLVIWLGAVAAGVLAIWALVWALMHGAPPAIELPGPHDIPHH